MEKSEDTCRRFDSFIKNAKPGFHLFRGNLFECKPTVDGKKVTALEIECDWRYGMGNRITIEEVEKEKSEYYFDARCF